MLTGEKVTLRAVQREDIPVLWELLWADLEVRIRGSMRPPTPRSLAEYEVTFQKDLEDSGHAIFAIEAGGEVIGDGGLFGINHFHRFASLGIAIGQPYWNKGYGQDTVRTLLAYGFRHLNLNRIGLEVLADDPRAIGAYRAAGFVEEGRIRQRDFMEGTYHDTLVMGVLRDEWEEAR